MEHLTVRPEGLPQQLLLQLLSLDVIHRVVCPVNTQKYSASHFLSFSIVSGYTKFFPVCIYHERNVVDLF